MPNISKHAKVICPFFAGGDHNYIRCETTIPGSWLRYIFLNNTICQNWMDKYCCTRGWEDCPYANMLLQKYEQEDKEK